MSTDTTGAEYPSLRAFYRQRDRKTSPEADYGVHWHTRRRLGRAWSVPWRVSYVQATGEIYATPADGNGPVRVLGVLQADHEFRPGQGVWYAQLDRVLEGWADPEVTGGWIGWVRGQLAARGIAR